MPARFLRFFSLALAFLLPACRDVPRELSIPGVIPQDIYIWQRVWSSAVPAALRETHHFGSYVVLTAEISITGGAARVTTPTLDYAALKRTGVPIGLAIRIAPYPGPFTDHDSAITAAVATARERIAEARRQGVEPVELQIDFDCAEAKLAGYRTWLQVLREAVAPLPVCPTVLPSWLKRADFAPLAHDCGRFVLQVHSVAAPRELASLGKLTEPAQAVAWVEQAAKLGVPFRVALPTYTYLAAFDSAGHAVGISAEGPAAHWPAAARVVRWEADPADLAGLVARWAADRPRALTGLIWYRLPVEGDSLNWRWATLDAVSAGRVPASALRAEASAGPPSDLALINDGERDEPLPAWIEARWSGARLRGADALEGYTLTIAEPGLQRFERRAGAELSRLPPGARRPIGWIRCEPTVPIQITLAPSPAAAAGTAGDGIR